MATCYAYEDAGNPEASAKCANHALEKVGGPADSPRLCERLARARPFASRTGVRTIIPSPPPSRDETRGGEK